MAPVGPVGAMSGFRGTAAGQCHEDLLQARPRDLQVTERDAAAHQVADGGVGVQRIDRDAGVAQTSTSVTPSSSESDARSGRSQMKHSRREATAALRVAPGPSATTLPWLSTKHAVGDLVRLGQMMSGEQHGAALVPECIIRQKPWRASTSMAEVGSSRNTTSGSPAMAMAKRTRWACPPESRSVRRRRSAPMSARSTIRSSGAGRG